MNVTVKNSKKADGRDGLMWSCDLYIDGVKAAHVYNQGNGGMTFFQWDNPTLGKSFESFAQTTPHGSGEMLVSDLCDKLDTQKMLKRLCKNKTVVKMKKNKEGEYSIWNVPFTQQVKEKILQANGDQVIEFMNEKYQ
jgi:hypothetical protein